MACLRAGVDCRRALRGFAECRYYCWNGLVLALWLDEGEDLRRVEWSRGTSLPGSILGSYDAVLIVQGQAGARLIGTWNASSRSMSCRS